MVFIDEWRKCQNAFLRLKPKNIFRKYLSNNVNYLKRANYRLKKRNQEWNVLSIVRELLIVLTRTKKLNRDFIGMHQYKVIVKTKEYMKIASRQLILIFIMSVFRYVYISTCVTCFLALRKDYFQLHQTYVYFVLHNDVDLYVLR